MSQSRKFKDNGYIFWLNRSYEICKRIGKKKSYTVEEYDAFENLTSRFARAIDFLINKVFRNIPVTFDF